MVTFDDDICDVVNSMVTFDDDICDVNSMVTFDDICDVNSMVTFGDDICDVVNSSHCLIWFFHFYHTPF